MLRKFRNLVSIYGLTDAVRIFVALAIWKGYNMAMLWATGVRIGRGVIFEGAVQVHGGKRIKIGDQVRLGAGVTIDAGSSGEIVIGSRTYVGRFTTVIANRRVEIGQDCLISPFCYIIDSDHGFQKGLPIRSQKYTINPVVIGDDVWIGVGSAVLKGVSIGAGSVIGARSVVTKDIPESVIAVGSPARVVKEKSPVG